MKKKVKNKKEVVVIVPGTKGLYDWPEIINSIGGFIDKIFGLNFVLEYKKDFLNKHLKNKSRDVIVIHWEQGFGVLTRMNVKLKLYHILRHFKNYDVKLVGISIGGEVILDVLRRDDFPNVKKIVLLGSVHLRRLIDFKNPPIINLYSKSDRISQLGVNLINPFFLGRPGGRKIYGKRVKNIELPFLIHRDFCADSRIEKGRFKGKKLHEVVGYYLEH